MIGVPNPLTALFVLLVFVAVPLTFVALLVGGVIFYRRGQKRRAQWFLGYAITLGAISWVAVALWFPAPRNIDLNADLATAPTIGDSPEPTGRRTLANGVDQRFFSGNVTVHLALPDGKILAGHSGHVTLYDLRGRFAGLSLFLTPSQGNSDFLAYWTDGGTVVARSEDNERITIQRAGYRVFYNAPRGPTPPMIDIRTGDGDSPSLIIYESNSR